MTISRICFLVAAVFFFLAAVGSAILPNETAWGLFFVALGLVAGGVTVAGGRVVVA